MDAFTSLYVWQMMYLQMRLYDENFGEKFSSYRRIFAQISIWVVPIIDSIDPDTFKYDK